MRTRHLAVAALLGITLAACGRTDPVAAVEADANAIIVGPPETGTLKLRKIYDYGPAGFQMPSGYRYETSFQANGEYNFPEPVFEGWPIRVTPIDAAGNATGAGIVSMTLRELHEGGGRYLDLPAGRYRVEELQPVSTAGGGVWVTTGANATLGGTTTSHATGGPVTVEVIAGSGHADATVVRFFGLCRVGGQPVRFLNDESAVSYSMPEACAPTFDEASQNPSHTSLDASFGNGGWAWADLGREGTVAETVAVLADGRIAIAGTGGVTHPQDPTAPRSKLPAALVVFTASGQPDSRFSGDGVALLDPEAVGPLGDQNSVYFSKVLGMSDGRILVVGTHEVVNYSPFTSTQGWVLARYLADGSLDTSFGGDGVVSVIPPGAQSSTASGRLANAALLPDGKILTVGSANQQIAVARFDPDGTLDTAFGNNGVTRIQAGPVSFASALTVSPDGRLIVGGVTYDDGEPGTAVLARLNANGQPDTTYGEGGVQTFDFAGWWDSFTSVLALPDGRVVAAGTTQMDSSGSFSATDVIVMQFLPSGARDPSFGANGLVRIDDGGEEASPTVLRDSDGRLVLQIRSSSHAWVLARITPSGLLDPSFGSGGLARFTSPLGGQALAVALQPDGKIVVAGYIQRLLPNQQPTSFMAAALVIP